MRNGVARWLDADFMSSALFEEAITHRSAGPINNERLEYLGDAVLGMVIAEYLLHARPRAREGDLSRLRAYLVRKQTLADIARELCLGEMIRLGPGELRSGGHHRETILADALEAIIGAVYLVNGLEQTKRFILGLFASRVETLPDADELKDPKTRLQELLQSKNLPLPEYTLLEITGESHTQRFKMLCRVRSHGMETEGYGGSKREAQQEAAQTALDRILGQRAG
jgi:ribonuclease-3